MSDIRLLRPAAGTNQAVACEPEANFIFEFPTDAATLSRSGDDLVMTFEDGATLSLTDFYKTYSSENMPSFDVGGSQVAGADFFAAMNEPDLMPAAGPGGNTAPGGGRYHEYANMALYDGLDRLGGLDVGWPDGGYEPDLDGGLGLNDTGMENGIPTITPTIPETLGPDTPVFPPHDPDEPFTPGGNTNPFTSRDVLTVSERGLKDGTDPSAPTTAQGSMHVESRDGVERLEVGGEVVYENGQFTPKDIPTDEGVLHVTGFNPETGELTYDYELTDPSQEHSEEGADKKFGHDIPVTVTDPDGDSASSTITVVVEDDAPQAEHDNAGMVQEGSADHLKGVVTDNDKYGADGEGTFGEGQDAHKVEWNLESYTDITDNGDGSWTVHTEYGDLTLMHDGSYDFKAKEDAGLEPGKSVDIQVPYTITDTDGDESSANLTITVTADNNTPEITTNVPTPDGKHTASGSGGHIVVDEKGSKPDDSSIDWERPEDPETNDAIDMDHSSHGQSGKGTFNVQLNGESGTVTLTDGHGHTVEMHIDKDGSYYLTGENGAELPEGGIQLYVNGVEVTLENDGTLGAKNSDGSWTVEYNYELSGPQAHAEKNNETTDLNEDTTVTGEEITITVKDETGDTATGKLTSEVHDGIPALTSEVHAPNFDVDKLYGSEGLDIQHSGKVTADFGMDAWPDGETGKVEFDLEGMAGENHTITVFVDGQETEARLTVTEEGTLKATVGDETLFEASIDEDGNWTMTQHRSFQVQEDDGTPSDSFSLKFKTADSDGDIARAESEVPVKPSVITPDGKNENNNWELQDDHPVTDNPSGTPGVDPAGGDPDSVSKAGNIVAGDFGGVTAGQTEVNAHICFLLDKSYSMHFNMDKEDPNTPSRWATLKTSVENFMESLEDKDFTGEIEIGFIPFGTDVDDSDIFNVTVRKESNGNITYEMQGEKYDSFEEFKEAFSTVLEEKAHFENGQATNYDAAFQAAQKWFAREGMDGQNSTYFLTDGSPTVHLKGESIVKGDSGDGSCLDPENIYKALESYQAFLNSFAKEGKEVDVHAVGFSSGVGQKGLSNLALFDNTPDTGTYDNDGVIYYQKNQSGTVLWGNNEKKIENGEYPSGRSAFADDADSLAGALDFTLPQLKASGSDTIDSSKTSASSIIFGDILNTDMLLHALKAALEATDREIPEGLIDGSGYNVFTWLEHPENAEYLEGTEFANWNADKTNEYITQHIGELARETYMDSDGNFYTVDAEGKIYDKDGHQHDDITLDQLRGRSGGTDDITGSNQNDLIFGQEGNDTIHGGDGNDYLYGGTGNDYLYGDAGTDYLNGGAGNDYLNGGDGSDTLDGGSGDDLIVYRSDDYAVFGGDGIDVLLSNDKNADSLDDLLKAQLGQGKPHVDGVEVFLKDNGTNTERDFNVEDLTSLSDLADKAHISITDTDGDGNGDRLALGEGWESVEGTNTYVNDDLGLTVELQNMEQVDPETNQLVFQLQNTNS